MKIRKTDLPEVLIIEPDLSGDERGWFMETFNARDFAAYGLPARFEQDNHSSSHKGVIRGLHYQLDPPQGKLVRCVSGSIFDVAVDIWRDSATFRRWVGTEVSAENRLMIWVPAGFAHGFLALTDAEVIYKCTSAWNPDGERSIAWNDPSIQIDWNVTAPIVSIRDAKAPRLEDADLFTRTALRSRVNKR